MKALAVIGICLTVCIAHADNLTNELLKQCCSVGPADIEKLIRGEALGKLVETGDERDLALMGAVKLSVPKQVFLNWYRKVENYTTSELISAAAQLHNPPQAADFEKFRIDPNEIKHLKACIPGKCGVKLSAAQIRNGQQKLDWSSTAAEVQAEKLIHEVLLAQTTAYMKRGDEAMPMYDDRPVPMDVGKVFLELVSGSPYIKTNFPELATHLDRYEGTGSAQRDEELFYCTREKYGFGLKPLLNVTHAMIHQHSPEVVVILTKQIWASHYYDGSLGMTVLIDAKPGTYLIYINRSRIDLLKSTGFKRALVNRFAPGATRKEVMALKKTVENSAEAKAYASN